MLNDDLIERERRALETIRLRSKRGVGGAFSPLENMDGRNAFFDSIDALIDSPLCWPGVLSLDYELQADRVLESLRDLYERAVQPWEQFRTVHPPLTYMLVWATAEADQDAGALPIYSRWPNGTFPAKIQGEAKARYWLLKSTSRSLVEDIPNKWSLEGVIPASSTLKFEHATGMAAVVCIARALEQFTDTLTEWACVTRKKIPGQSFEWLVQHKPALLERLLAEYVASSANRYEAERALRVATLTKNAQAWLELANTEDDHQAEIERVSGVVAEQATTQALSNNTRKAAQSKNADPRAWVLSEWKSREDKGQGKAAFARQYAALVKKKFDVVVIPDTIARAWLKEVKP